MVKNHPITGKKRRCNYILYITYIANHNIKYMSSRKKPLSCIAHRSAASSSVAEDDRKPLGKDEISVAGMKHANRALDVRGY